ncbi:MAG: prephenate dehydrogenase, partial [Burkholderiaceae bacterium]
MKLALIGVGLIGGSFARALRGANRVEQIVGFDTDANVLGQARELGVIDIAAASAAAAGDGADVVIIAVPVGSMRETLRAIARRLATETIVTDVASTKVGVLEAAREELGLAFARFVPGHPIAGREQSGVSHSDSALFRGKLFISTPVPSTATSSLEHVESLWRDVGCRIERMTAEDHDRVFAAVSHLPHLLAFALVAHIAAQPDADRKFELAGSGFRDYTRIAGSSASTWSDICVSNRAAIGDELRRYRALLEKLQRAVDAGDDQTLRLVFG